MKEVASWLHLPPTSNPKTTNLQRRLRRSSGYVCSFLRRASRRAAPAKVPPRCLGTPSRVSGDTRVVSTASWFPPHKGRPLAMTSILLSSWRSRCSRLRSTRRVFVVTRAPASLHMRAAARSMAPPVLAKVQTAHKPRGGRQEGLERDGTGRSGQIRAVAIGGATREAGGTGGSGSCCHCGRGLW